MTNEVTKERDELATTCFEGPEWAASRITELEAELHGTREAALSMRAILGVIVAGLGGHVTVYALQIDHPPSINIKRENQRIDVSTFGENVKA